MFENIFYKICDTIYRRFCLNQGRIAGLRQPLFINPDSESWFNFKSTLIQNFHRFPRQFTNLLFTIPTILKQHIQSQKIKVPHRIIIHLPTGISPLPAAVTISAK